MAAAPEAATPRPRVYALDAARGFAIFAMVIAHTAIFIDPAPRAVRLAEALLNDVAAPLFALLIGATITLTAPSRDESAPDDRSLRRKYRVQTALKAAVLIVLGFLLSLRYSGVAVVLEHLGVMLLLLIPFLFARTRTLLIWAVALLAVTPGVVIAMRNLAATNPTLVFPKTPVTVLLDWLVLGRSYQATIFLMMALFGIAIGRSIMRDRRAQLITLAVSGVAFVLAKGWQIGALPGIPPMPGNYIRGGYGEVLNETALAIMTFAAILLLTDLAPEALQRITVPAFAPFAVQGRMALSLYVFHVLVLMWLISLKMAPSPEIAAWVTWPRGLAIQLGLVVLCWAVAALWDRWLGPGPVERIIGVATLRHPPSYLVSKPAKR